MLLFIGNVDIAYHLASFGSVQRKSKIRMKRKIYWSPYSKRTLLASTEQEAENETSWKQSYETRRVPDQQDNTNDEEEAEEENMNRVIKELSQRFDWPKESLSSKKQVSVDPILFHEPSFLQSHSYEDFIKESEQAKKRNHVESMDTESFMRLFENARKGWLSCPQCKGLAPPEEIEKWGWCSYCHAEIDLKKSPAEILYPQEEEKKTDKQKKSDSIRNVSKRVVQREWNVSCSKRALETINPIRQLVQGMAVKPNPDKKLIPLSIGDPTAFGNLRIPREAMKVLSKVLAEDSAHGYSNSLGNDVARSSIANKYSSKHHSITKDDIILTCGTSGALEMIFNALCNPGDNVLIPRPGFPLFKTLLDNLGVEVRYYDLDPHQQWQIRLEQLPKLVDSRTAALVVNNPSNPCGSVFSYSHMMAILEIAQRLCIPIVADEVYSDMTFSGSQFFSFGSLSEYVPILSVGSVSKMFVAPGWRLGWIIIHDRQRLLETGNVIQGLRQLSMRMLVPSSPFQMVLPTLFSDSCKSDFVALVETLEDHAKFTVDSLSKIRGLSCTSAPQGSMYCMVHVDSQSMGFQDDMEWATQLLAEESVLVLPGQCFQAPHFFRIVYCAPKAVLNEAFSRIRRFCENHQTN
ncbi:hypothetical protein GpartN1_g4213.t1 [Galdieria partita]|uniref:Aminotransferase class I/classII large domain-containing protein n=1 Tax=Galdieria partita TaxID=83374 RepID=A0A9C7PYW1_9RHOD|nr:hypothetical protein GpartN1_g4213.t1 [Galdieria partita]